ncbi:MAG TPA: OB-fold nucleic acid binding domain-containing protein [Candidatus Nanoarchaeia archaeon]|nr:OB-fold nucleic acid binding domain-containing protein [Candidatus Nanoarchaeia archaeon]
MTENKPFLRQTAIKTNIQDLTNSIFVETSENEQNYLLLKDQRVYRINILGIVIKKEKNGSMLNLLIDDKTGLITVRFFEENDAANRTEVEDCISVIGKLRKYNNEKYISPEIFKKVDPLWLKTRIKELNALKKDNIVEQRAGSEVTESQQDKLAASDNCFNDIPLVEKITNLIKELDQGSGVQIEELIDKSVVENIEKVINQMLERGDIFQNQPGRVKVL